MLDGQCEHDWQPASPSGLVFYCTKCRALSHPSDDFPDEDEGLS